MPEIVEIVEILKPSYEGRTTPFICRGDDNYVYYVKGRNAGCNSWWGEWIGAHLGRALSLDIPPFNLVYVDQALLDEAPHEWRVLGEGTWFGSCKHPVASWFEPELVSRLPLEIQCDVAVFDWWIRNGDRGIGNPNLLWDAVDKRLVVIDHNMAFDNTFTEEEFLEHHVFADAFRHVRDDMHLRSMYADRLSRAIHMAQVACDNAPAEWRWANAEQDIPCSFDIKAALTLLRRCTNDQQLWRTV